MRLLAAPVAQAPATQPTVLRWLLLQQAMMLGLGLWIGLGAGLWSPEMFQLSTAVLLLGTGLALLLILLAGLAVLLMPAVMTRLQDSVVVLWARLGIQLTPVVIVVLSLSAGIAEELLFRGAFQQAAMDYMPMWLAIGLVALLFGLAHAASVEYFLAATLMGLVFGSAFYLTQSLLCVIIGHTLYDLWAFGRLRGLIAAAPDEQSG